MTAPLPREEWLRLAKRLYSERFRARFPRAEFSRYYEQGMSVLAAYETAAARRVKRNPIPVLPPSAQPVGGDAPIISANEIED